ADAGKRGGDPFGLVQIRMAVDQQPIENHAERVDVRAQIDAITLSAGLLRAHVLYAALHYTDRCRKRTFAVALAKSGEPEIQNFDPRAVEDHDVRRFDIAVHHSLLMCVADRIADRPE